MNRNNFTTIIQIMRRALEKEPKLSFNQLRKTNDLITTTAENFFIALREHRTLVPTDIKFSPVKGKIDPNVVADLEIEKASS